MRNYQACILSSKALYGYLTLFFFSLQFTGIYSFNVGTIIFGKAPESLKPPLDLLEGSNLGKEGTELKRCYKASEDGFSAVNFHKCVDGKGSAIVIALSRTGAVFGGYNPLGWRSSDDYNASTNAWLWFDGGRSNVKVPILQGGNAAVFDYATGGPCFGSSDLIIGSPKAAVMGGFAGPDMEDVSINAGDLRECMSDLGGAYEFVDGWPCRGKCSLVEVEVYVNANVESLGNAGGGWWPF